LNFVVDSDAVIEAQPTVDENGYIVIDRFKPKI
jgi:hypothetical protein